VAFGAARVILLAGSAHPFHPKALRASAGAVLAAPLAAGPAIDALPMDLSIVPLSREGKDLGAVAFPAASALLPGVEGPGLPEPWRPLAVAIPHRPEVESLNAAVAVSIALYVATRGRINRSRAKSGG
jgi:tRNA G18 (ribose-2'-O)-methylase SpoU